MSVLITILLAVIIGKWLLCLGLGLGLVFLLAVIITQAFRIRRLKKEIIKRDTADEFSRQWYWIEDKNNKQRQPLKKRKSLLSFLRSFL